MTTVIQLRDPHFVGEQETGCLTHEGNDLVLYHQTTEKSVKELEKVFEKTFSFIMGKRGNPKVFRGVNQSTDRVHFSGIAGEAIYDSFCRRMNYFLDEVIASYRKEIGRFEWELPIEGGFTLQLALIDFKNWAFREFECWLPDRIRKE